MTKFAYGGRVRDENGISRITYLDVSAEDPSNLLYVSDSPALDIGAPGCFDDNGMILGDILRVEDRLYLYYVGFQHVEKVKFHAFSGLAVSCDEGRHFTRQSQTPIMDRTDTGRFGRCIHSVLHEDGKFKIYYAVINDWRYLRQVPYPVYNIWYTESEDGRTIPGKDERLAVDTNSSEYRIGRPKVYRKSQGYEMYYTRDLLTKEYKAGYAVSEDGKEWTRKDEEFTLQPSCAGWDSEMLCYPVIVGYKDRTYMFYNGNGMGRTGVGYAVSG